VWLAASKSRMTEQNSIQNIASNSLYLQTTERLLHSDSHSLGSYALLFMGMANAGARKGSQLQFIYTGIHSYTQYLRSLRLIEIEI
jgi:hypothetical protein